MAKYYMSNSNLFINGGNTTGVVGMLEIDNIKAKDENYESLGMLFDKEVAVGMAQMTGKMSFAGPAPDFFNQNAFAWESSNLLLLGVMIDKAAGNAQANKQFECKMKVRPSEIGAGKFEPNKLTQFDRTFKIDTLMISMGGVVQMEFDAENNIFKVNGEDKWKEYRTLLGQ